MGGGGKNRPSIPDYQGLAELEAQSAHPNVQTPWGSQQWQQQPGGQWSGQVSLNPSDQATLDTQRRLQQQQLGGQEQMLPGAIDRMRQGVDWTGLGQMPGQQLGDLSTTAGSVTPTIGGVSSTMGDLSPTMAGVSPTLTNLPTGQQARDQAITAAYSQATSRLDPQYQQQDTSLRNRLYAQGLREGDQAYDTAMENLGRSKTDAYNQALYGAIGQGTEAGKAIFQQALQGGQAQFGQQYELANALYGQELAQRQGAFEQNYNLANTGFQQNLSAAQTQFNQDLARRQALWGEGMQERQQSIGEQQTRQYEPWQAYSALAGGMSPVQMPSMGGMQNAPGTQYLQAGQLGYDAYLNNYNAGQANRQGAASGLSMLGGLGGGAMFGPAGYFGGSALGGMLPYLFG